MLTVVQLVTKMAHLLRNPKVHYRVHGAYPEAEDPQFISSHHIPLRSILILAFHLCLCIHFISLIMYKEEYRL
jgi:hypothetical protein